jgi:5-formyltetrahydrofolate cyclo-ligase
MRKEDLRRQIKQIKRQFTPQQLEELSLPVISRLKPLLAEAQTIMAYYSLPDEVNTHGLIDDLVAEGKTVLLPKVTGPDTMELRRYTGRDDLQEGAYHILEPMGELFTDFSSIDLILVPGLAFDAAGHRLGRGRGYYDRLLSSLFTIHSSLFSSIGVCFDFQKVDEVPVDAHDIAMDKVV